MVLVSALGAVHGLGSQPIAHTGRTMTTAATAATYAYDQIEQVRAELNAVSK